VTDNVSMWLFGILGAWMVALSGFVLSIKLEQVKTKVAVDLFIDTLGEKIAKALHADDDHLGLDSLLDKYLDRKYDLTYDELFELKNRCNHILESKAVSHLERSLAGMMAAVCEQALIGKFGKTRDNV
jgi:hypothetical protein